MLKSNSISRTLLAFLTLGLFLFQSCENDEENNYYWAQDIGVLTLTDLAGIVKDENGNPISGVLITSHHLTALTNNLGFFNIPDTWSIRGRVQLKMEKTGYLDGYYAGPTQGEKTIFNLILSQGQTEQISASQENTIKLSEFATVQLPANGFVTADGAAYSGNIEVTYKHFDPRDPNFSYVMPGGDFRGIDESGEEMLLISYGAIAVELASPSGEEIQLAEGQTALIELEVPEDMLADAPSTIPLWHFNEETAIWEEEGFATLEGSKYVGEVSHFSFWNCDDPVSDRSFVAGVVKDCNGEPLVGVAVQVGPLIVYTDENGFYESNVAIDLAFEVSISELDEFGLNPSIYVSSVADGEYLVLEDLALDFCPSYLEGEIQDCDGNVIEAGFLTLSWEGNSKILTFSDGTFNTFIPSATTITISAFSTSFQGETTFDSPEVIEAYSLNNIFQICNEVTCSSALVISDPLDPNYPKFNGQTVLGTTWVPFKADEIGLNEFADGIISWNEMKYASIISENHILTILYNDLNSGPYTLNDIQVIYDVFFPIYSENPEISMEAWNEQLYAEGEEAAWFDSGEITLILNSDGAKVNLHFDGIASHISNAFEFFSFVTAAEGSACFDLSE